MTEHEKHSIEERGKSIFDNQEQNTPWLTSKEAAAYLKLKNLQGLYDCVFRGQLKPVRIGRRLRFHKEKLDQWLLSQN